METNKTAEALAEISRLLDKCADEVPYELSARENLYFRMVDMAKEARGLARELREK